MFYLNYFLQQLEQFQFKAFSYILINGQNRNAIVNGLLSRINRIQCLGRLWRRLRRIT